MVRTGQGVKGFKFTGAGRCAPGAWTQLDSGSGLDPFCDADSTPFDCADTSYCTSTGRCANQDPSYYATIQFADIDGEAGEELLGRMADGLWAYKWNGSAWTRLTTNQTFSDQFGWTAPQYYTTIQTTALKGGDTAQVVARAGSDVVANAGIIAYSYASGSWAALEPNTTSLTLEDDPWAASASYYRTIQAGDVDGDGRDDLLGRGPYGIRTWFFDRRGTGVWERFLPYGYAAFPAAGQQRALRELTALAKNLPQTCSPLPESDPSVRSRYDGTDEGVTLSELQAYEACLQGAEGCDCAGDAPPFARCTPPAGSGVSEGDWTAVCNRILDEAIAAQNVLVVFGHIENIQTSLFITENASLPGIVSDLKLQEAGDNPSASFTFADAFVEMLEAAGSFAGVFDGPVGGGLDIAGELMSSLISAVPSLSDTVDTTYEQLQVELASRVQDSQKAFAANQYWILQDQGLLAAVGGLGSSKGAWQKIDDVGMESMGRYGFALWIYQTLLPAFWQRYDITSCVSPSDPDYPGCNLSKCTAPPPAPYLSSYAPGGASFAGLMPPDSQVCLPCDSVACPDCTYECFYSQLPPDDTVAMVWGALAASCAYEPGNPNTEWTWPDCTLGISAASGSPIFTNRDGWNFPIVTGNPIIE